MPDMVASGQWTTEPLHPYLAFGSAFCSASTASPVLVAFIS